MIGSAAKNWLTFLITGLTTLLGASLYFDAHGMSDASFEEVLETTGRLAFVLFMVVFIARPLRQLKPTPFRTRLLKNRRLLGVAFAGMHFAHLFIIFYRQSLNPEFGFPRAGNIPGAIAYLFIGLMFITSFDSAARALGAKRWRLLHTVALYYIFIIFDFAVMKDLAKYFYANGTLDIGGAAVMVLAIVALAIRLTPLIKRVSS